MELDPDDIERLSSAIARFERVISAMNGERNTGNSTILVNGGSLGAWIAVWVATLSCAVMLTMSVLSRSDQVDQSRRIDLANDKLSIILQWAPQLKDIVDKQIQLQHKQEK